MISSLDTTSYSYSTMELLVTLRPRLADIHHKSSKFDLYFSLISVLLQGFSILNVAEDILKNWMKMQ